MLTTWAMPWCVPLGLFKHHPLMEFFNRILKVGLWYLMGMLENMYEDWYIPKFFAL